MKKGCVFSTDISETLSCCRDGQFDDYGFPKHFCKDFPCWKYLDIVWHLDYPNWCMVTTA